MVRKLHIDFETYSSVDISDSGNAKYVESPDFEILLMAYAFDEDKVGIVDFAQGESWPSEVLEAFNNPGVIICAHNAAFERRCLAAYGMVIDPSRFECTAVKAAYCGYPIALAEVTKAMGMTEEDTGKMAVGKRLIAYFSCPVKPTASNGYRMRNLPKHNISDWNLFKEYCKQDVVAEREIDHRLGDVTIPNWEKRNYVIDQYINDHGVLLDLGMAKNAIDFDERFSKQTMARAMELTGLENPNSPAQLKTWLSEQLGRVVRSLTKDDVVRFKEESTDPLIREVMDCRLKLAKTSTKKYIAMEKCACQDHRARGLFQFYGANRTGRWAARLIQLQNLPQNHMKDLDLARKIVAAGDYNTALMLWDSIPNVLSELIRTALIAPYGKVFAVADFSAIEARVLSWFAQEDWRLEVFRTHGKIYEAAASLMFGVPIEQVTKGSELRQRGKTAELALGYEGGKEALRRMDRESRIPENELMPIVKKWRKANPKVVQFWKDVEMYAQHTVQTHKTATLGSLTFRYENESMTIELPSGRKLFYVDARMGVNRFGRPSIVFKGIDYDIKQWGQLETYGGKLTENIVQAASRDLLAEAIQRMYDAGLTDIVIHVHDEVVIEVPEDKAEKSLKTMIDIMGTPIPWMEGLPLRGDGYITRYYKKD